jgi:hypothetical protein
MNKAVLTGVGVAVLVGGYFAYHALERQRQQQATAGHWQAIEHYCVDCHNAAELAGGLSFESLRNKPIAERPDVWEHVVRKLEAGLMPPPEQPRPDAERLAGMIAYLTDTLDAAAEASPQPGAPALHRLNRTEYANVVRDLLDMPIDATTLLPGDDSSAGFDNMASALSVSPVLMQAYVSSAAKISRLAIGDPTTSSGITTYSVPRDMAQDNHIEGLPLGTRGGLLVNHVFPLDAEYEIVVRRGGSGFGLQAVGGADRVELSLNGERLALLEREPSAKLRIPAGPQQLGVAMIASSRARGVDDIFNEWAQASGVQSISILGPFDATGVSETPSRKRLFICQPRSDGTDDACARQILTTLATRAYRRPMDEASLATLLEFFEQGRQLRGFEAGIQYALARALVDVQFIYRLEEEPPALADGAVYELGDFEIASRLSFFLWSSMPDDELLAAAAAGQLTDPRARAEQVRRMLADPKAAALAKNFASQWFGLRQLASALPETNEFDGNLRASLARETELFFDSIVREDRSIVEVLDADYTYVDERLALHYGIPHVRGSLFRRVDLAADNPRRGILGHGSVHTVTSPPNRTSPVSRGAWVLKNLLGIPPPSPPPGVETNLDQSAAAGTANLPLRARFERHRADPSCAACHAMIDPLGFSLENFDLIGQWRGTDSGQPIDASVELWDGTSINGPSELRAALVERKELFVTHAVEVLLTYALGRALEPTDMPAVRRVVRGAAEDGYRFSSLVLGVTDSVPFTMKVKAPLQSESSGG